MPATFWPHAIHSTADCTDTWDGGWTDLANQWITAASAGTSLANATTIANTAITNYVTNWKMTMKVPVSYYTPVSFTVDEDLDPMPVTGKALYGVKKALAKQKVMGTLVKNTLDSDDAPPRRKRPPLEFNKYINASDLLEEYIAWLGTQDVRQREVMDLPIELFVKWLIIRACEADAIEPEVELKLPPRKQQPRCLGCGQFVKRTLALPMHDARCYNWYAVRQAKAQEVLVPVAA